jgi:GAF domain-containing protein
MADEDLLARLLQIADDVGPALTPTGHEELLRSIVGTARELFGAAASSLALLSDDGEHLSFLIASGAGAERVEGTRFSASAGIAGFAVQSGQALVIEDARSDPRFAADVADSSGYQPTRIIAVPLQTERAVIGVLEILDATGERRERELDLVGLFADQAALAIENARTFSHLGQTLLQAVSRAAQANDPDMARALAALASTTTGAPAELAELAEVFAALGEVGERERAAVTDIAVMFLRYARESRRM